MSDSSQVLAFVSAARRRQRLVMFVRLALLVIPLAIAVTAIGVWLIRPAAPALAITLGVAAVVALVGAAAASLSRTPSSRQTAAALDRGLMLEDRLVTSMTCLTAPDPVAGLLLRETAARIRGARVARVFPFEAPARFVWVLIAAVLAVALASARPDSNATWTTNRPGNGIVMGGGRAIGTPSGLNARPQAEAPGVSTQTAQPDATEGVATGRRQSSDPPSSTEARDASTASRPASEAATPEGTAGASTTAMRSHADVARANRGDGSGRRDGSSGAAAGGTTTGGASGRAQGAAARASSLTVSAGGIAGGTLTATPPGDRSIAPLDPAAYAALDANAWSQAQIAMGHAKVSAAMREYVTRYFESIRGAAK